MERAERRFNGSLPLGNRCIRYYSYSGAWNWVHSARRPLNGLLYLPRVIVMMDNLVEWRLAGEPKYLEKTCPSATLSTTNPTCHTRARTRAAAVGSQRLTSWTMARPILGINIKSKLTVQYPDLLSAIRHILHSEDFPLPSLPGTLSVGDESYTECNGETRHCLLM
jgi:hypothetical protein